MSAPTTRMRLADLILGRPVVEFIGERRAAGQSWPAIRDALREATGGEIAITWQAVQQWHGKSAGAAADVA